MPVELDGQPGIDIKFVKRVVDSTKHKVYDRINVSECVWYQQCKCFFREQLVINVDKKLKTRKQFVIIKIVMESVDK